MNNQKSNNGFTVLEVIITIVIITIISTLAIYFYRQYIAKSYQTIAITMLQIYKMNMVKYSLDNNINLDNNIFFENFYNDFSRNMLNPNNNSNYNKYYTITHDNNFLIAVPTKKNDTKLYAKMRLDKIIIEKCKITKDSKEVSQDDICEEISNYNKKPN